MSTSILEVRLASDQLDELADAIYRKLNAAASYTRPLTLREAAQALNISYATLNRRVASGLVRTVDGIGCRRVSQSEIRRLLGEEIPTETTP